MVALPLKIIQMRNISIDTGSDIIESDTFYDVIVDISETKRKLHASTSTEGVINDVGMNQTYEFPRLYRLQVEGKSLTGITSVSSDSVSGYFTMHDIYQRIKNGKFFKSATRKFQKMMRAIDIEIAMLELRL